MARFPLGIDVRLSVGDVVWLTTRAARRGESVSATLRDAIAAARKIEAAYESDETSFTHAADHSADGSALEA